MDINLKTGEKVKVLVTKEGEIYKYYIQGRQIGVYDPKIMEDNILMLENTLENELSSQIKDGIDSVEKGQIEIEAEENERILEYAREQKVENINDITIIEFDDDEDEKDKDNSQIKQQKQEIPTTTTSDINIKQEIDLNERANDMKDLKRWLGSNIPPEYTKMAVIESSQMHLMKDENGQSYDNNSTRYSLALIDKDNNVVPLEKYVTNLKQRDASGNNPSALKYQVDKGGNVEKDAILSEYEIGNKILQIDNKEMGRIEVNVGQEEHGGNRTMGVQVRDSNSTFATDTQTRQVIGEYESNGQYTVDENLKEAEEHGNCDEMTQDDIDGDLQTKSHNHIEEIDFDDLAIKWGFYKDGEPDAKKAKEYLAKEMQENPDKTVEENIDDLTDDFNDDFGGRGSRM